MVRAPRAPFGTAQKTATAAPKLPKGCPRGPGFATNRTASALFFPNHCRRVLAREVLVAAPCSPFGAERPKVGNRTAAGGGLRLPGLSATITPRPPREDGSLAELLSPRGARRRLAPTAPPF